MQGLIRFLLTAVIINAVLMASGCAVYPARYDQGYGPPPHAPAHGYRYKHQGHDIVYDDSLGVYVVAGLQDYYFYDNYYYRYDHDHWSYSDDLDRDWRTYNASKLPHGLAEKYGQGKKEKGKDRNRRNNNR